MKYTAEEAKALTLQKIEDKEKEAKKFAMEFLDKLHFFDSVGNLINEAMERGDFFALVPLYVLSKFNDDTVSIAEDVIFRYYQDLEYDVEIDEFCNVKFLILNW